GQGYRRIEVPPIPGEHYFDCNDDPWRDWHRIHYFEGGFMGAPPNSQTPQAIWDVWLAVDQALGSKVKLGGIYANKPGYHNTRAQNASGNYSVQLPLDKQGPSNKAAALDLTFPSASDMKKYTARLRDAMKAGDPRMGSVKEFYGTLDGKNVYGLGKKSRTGAPYSTSADKAHLWHIHISFFRADVENWGRLKGVAEIFTGKSASGSSGNSPTIFGGIMLPREGDKGPDVEFWQRMLLRTGEKLPKYGADAAWGAEMTAAVQSSRTKLGWDKVKSPRITAAHAEQLLLKAFAAKPAPAPAVKRQDSLLLQPGDQGEDVQLMQLMLQDAGEKLNADGVYGDETAAALKSFWKR